MPLDILAIFASGVALVFAIVSIALLTVWRSIPPDLAQFKRDLAAQENNITDLADRVHAWIRRESVRRAREKREQNEWLDRTDGWPESAFSKDELRQLAARQRGTNSLDLDEQESDA